MGANFSTFKPEFNTFHAVLMNYDAPADRWPAPLKASFEDYMKNGGGLVAVHAADNAFASWPAFNDMTVWAVGAIEASRPVHIGTTATASSSRIPLPARGQPWPARAVSSHPARQRSSHHQGAASGLDAPGRRVMRAAAWPGQEHDSAGNCLLRSGQRRYQDMTNRNSWCSRMARAACFTPR